MIGGADALPEVARAIISRSADSLASAERT